MIKDLVTLANNLDEKGLVKEADLVDSIIEKYSQAEYKDHRARKFVVSEINEKSKKVNINDRYVNKINMFTYIKSEPYVIKEGWVFNDDGTKLYFKNSGEGSPSVQVEELESLIKGVTTPGGVIASKDSIHRKESGIHSVEYNPTTKMLVVVYDDDF